MLHSVAHLSSGKSFSMPDAVHISIARQFSETPFGRYLEDGKESGQAFREKILLPLLNEGRSVVISLDGVAGLPSSFWEEALGGSVRAGIAADRLRELLVIETTEADLETYVRLGWRYIDQAEVKRQTNQSH